MEVIFLLAFLPSPLIVVLLLQVPYRGPPVLLKVVLVLCSGKKQGGETLNFKISIIKCETDLNKSI